MDKRTTCRSLKGTCRIPKVMLKFKSDFEDQALFRSSNVITTQKGI